MYPYELFFGLDLYSILMTLGVIVCMIFIRLMGDRVGFRARFQNLLLFFTVAAVVLGYGAAVLMQGLYNIAALGRFEITQSTGATFYGGLIGGTAVFIIGYFAVGHFLFRDGYHVRNFRTVSDIAPACITVAHGFGRLGCLMAGCCHGAPTDAWYGIPMFIEGSAERVRVVPVQLFEAMFLLALSAFLLWRFFRGKRYEMPTYMLTYGVWRFIAEYLRSDDRGQTIVDFLSPSQLTSVVLIVGGIALLVIELWIDRRKVTRSAGEGAP